ncbi:hypothetical protein CHARACLAT_022819 [Characodon lateralis]|uniref:Secreted protein n=1 Tax=Characodon lateralis TaxID=208331 RepID=A0ABU7CR45_9TELE|nr:hypothetical protein [Characodon lateralis]
MVEIAAFSFCLLCSMPGTAQESAACLWDTVCQANLPAFQVRASKRERERGRETEQECESEPGSCSSWLRGRKREALRSVSAFVNDIFLHVGPTACMTYVDAESCSDSQMILRCAVPEPVHL